ncbi:dehydrogenase of unknown specificity, short-chain alcohol dehydrogenase [Herbaspirillum sp. CF444]|uniref:SDR family NAD(P)-dependent oxidoreductase n=1 Tax=Herbaspirillum sp. CF444 TaxID=1144319 RepID=UPI00027233BE|nr:SDR family oxidoreductase [Herbaspirillum sp. CF444]EJL88743.1 dehydrogenase of unknown specificity, short-chain alcohol dehydrogenase [Herbaspirillum sp. CF444]
MIPNSAKTVLVTGGSRGIGRATARLFADNGWRVLTLSSKPLLADAYQSSQGLLQHISVDLANGAAIKACLSEIIRRLPDGRLHALVNNAGVSPKLAGGMRMGVMECDLQTWRRVFNINFFSVVQLVRGLGASLSSAGGVVVNVASIAGNTVHPFAGASYGTSKAALLALTREMAHDLGLRGVRVNAVSPGEIDTDILSPGTTAIVNRKIPLRRLGTPEEVASVIYFLCSDASSYLNGAEIHIDGGQHV